MATYLCLFKDLTEAEELYDKLTKKVGSLGGSAAGNINQRAKDMKKEAEDLLKKATEGLEKLKSMCQSSFRVVCVTFWLCCETSTAESTLILASTAHSVSLGFMQPALKTFCSYL